MPQAERACPRRLSGAPDGSLLRAARCRRALSRGAACVAALASLVFARPEDPASLARRIRDVDLLPSAAVSIKNVELEAGLALLRLEEGVLFPASPVGERTVEMVFLGKGSLDVDPPDEIEEGQLELFTGEPSLEGRFEEAVLVVARDAAVDAILKGRTPAPPDAAAARHAAEVFSRWKSGPERKLLDVEGALFLDAVGDPPMDGFFAAWFHSTERGDFIYVVDPGEQEPVTLGQFVPLEASWLEQRKIRRSLHAEQRRGRLIGLEVKDLGTWDTWLSGAARGAAGGPDAGTRGFDVRHYTLDVSLDPVRRALSGRARLDMTAVEAGRRGIVLRLHPDLQVERVADAGGRDLIFVRGGPWISVCLPVSPAAGEPVALKVEYGGNLLERVMWKTFTLVDTEAWYPQVGYQDRATYDVTFHHPVSYDLLASGREVETAEEPRRMRRVRRLLEVPAADFTFEIGNFKLAREQAGHVAVTVAFDPQSKSLSPAIQQQIREVVVDALDYFEETFGPYPLDHLAVVTTPRDFSQGLLGFVTLSDLSLAELGFWGWLMGIEDRRSLIAHEIAHQWWGNLVGWRSYRDQWLSEAMANYAALLYTRHRLLKKEGEGGFRGPLSGWRRELGRTTEDGRPLESLGPLVLGSRLSSSRSPDAYEAIVYKKGGVVLDMLARVFGEDAFREMLAHLVRAAGGRLLSTEEFMAALERMSGEDLGWFAQRYIYGTGFPEVDYSYAFERGGEGGWRVRGETRQRASYRFVYRVVEVSPGRLDVARDRVDHLDVEESAIVTPFEILVEHPGDAEAGKVPAGKKESGARAIVRGRMLIGASRKAFEIETEHRPLRFWLDRHGESLADYFCESRHPKRVTTYQALDLASAGRREEAEAAFRRALEAPVEADPDPDRRVDEKAMAARARALDAEIRLHMARLHLDRGREGEARRELESALGLLGRNERWRIRSLAALVQSRLEMRRGEYRAAMRTLRRIVPKRGATDDTEALVLMAIAARGAGDRYEMERAAGMASEQGADVTLLTGPPPAR